MGCKRIYVTGQRFTHLKVLTQYYAKVGSQNAVIAYAECECDCGTLKTYQVANLRNGKTKSCGCGRPTLEPRVKKLQSTWNNMIQRCTNSKNPYYRDYGGRGIRVCERWLDFRNFYKDMGDRPKGLTLDRTDNDKGYYKENCRWVTNLRNNQNKRNSRWWSINGVKYNSLREAANRLGVTPSQIRLWCEGYWIPPRKDCWSELN